MKAELNNDNQVVITMSRGEAQRVANAAWRNETSTEKQEQDCLKFAEEIEYCGIEFIFDYHLQ